MTSPAIACTLCGGNVGTLNPTTGNHFLCDARAGHGAATPCLGMRCNVCHGNGIKPGFQGGVPLFLSEGPARIARSIAAQFPACDACHGRGVVAA
jgi:hypothetical protein